MKNNAQAFPVPTVQRADAMLHIHPVITSGTFYRAEICGKKDHIPFTRCQYISFRLGPWNLFRDHKFTPV
jgi:hypothetical protein